MLSQDNEDLRHLQESYTPPPKDRKRPRGEDSHLAKLTWVRVRNIRRRAADGVPFSRIARDEGVSDQTIRQIVRNLTWVE